jgi:hypothetical protein
VDEKFVIGGGILALDEGGGPNRANRAADLSAALVGLVGDFVSLILSIKVTPCYIFKTRCSRADALSQSQLLFPVH